MSCPSSLWSLLLVALAGVVLLQLPWMSSTDVMESLAAREPSPSMIEAWKVAVVTVEFEGATVHPSVLATRFDKPVHMVTAWNPGAVEREPEVNARASAELKAELEDKKLPIFPGVGRDAASSWEEPGFAIVGLSRADIKDIGRRYGQVAVYEFNPDSTKSIVWCVGDLVVQI